MVELCWTGHWHTLPQFVPWHPRGLFLLLTLFFHHSMQNTWVQRVGSGQDVNVADNLQNDRQPAASWLLPMQQYRLFRFRLPGNNAAEFCLWLQPVSYTHLRAHETRHDLVCRLLLEK